MTYVLVTCKRKYSNGETGKSGNGACPMDDTNWTSTGHGISHDEVIDDQNHQVAYAHQGRDTGVFKRIQASKVGQRDDHQPARSQHSAFRILQFKI